MECTYIIVKIASNFKKLIQFIKRYLMLLKVFNGVSLVQDDHIIVRLSKEHKKLKYVEVFSLSFIVPQIKAFTILYF
jgi:hypothetical protein